VERPTLGIVAGPNGSGKTSFYEQFTEVAESKRNLAAATLAEEQRQRLIEERVTFAFETVFSRTEHWIGFLRKTTQNGYRLELFFLCTADPVMNAARVKTRLGRGGHSVPLDKVVARYPGSIRTALEAKQIVDETMALRQHRMGLHTALVGPVGRSTDHSRGAGHPSLGRAVLQLSIQLSSLNASSSPP
jgi:predicted ABC-type ATPase